MVDSPLGEKDTVASVRSWLTRQGSPVAMSLRVDRAFCGESIKDGRFGLARLRVGLAGRAGSGMRGAGSGAAGAVDDEAGSTVDEPAGADEHVVSYLRHDTGTGADCRVRKTARALEQTLALAPLQAMLRPRPAAAQEPGSRGTPGPATPGASPSGWSRAQIHALFPELLVRLEEALATGRRRLATDQLLAAQAAFEDAVAIDPEHLDARSFLAEVELALELRRQLAARQAEAPAGLPGAGWKIDDAQLSAAQVRALEEQLSDERRLREELLTTLAILGAEANESAPPDPATLARLRPGTITDPEAKGPRRARALQERQEVPAAGSPADPDAAELRTRVLYAPSGDVVARYYFAGASTRPLLVEEDTSGDGRLDRWTGYAEGVRRETWEEGRGPGLPDVHIVYDGGGRRPIRVELDQSRDGVAERVFLYRDGQLVSEFLDTGGDGGFDRVLHFEPDGSLARREEDLNDDGRIDVRTTYRSGRMVRREIMDPGLVDETP